jgi:hypothetical protein
VMIAGRPLHPICKTVTPKSQKMSRFMIWHSVSAWCRHASSRSRISVGSVTTARLEQRKRSQVSIWARIMAQFTIGPAGAPLRRRRRCRPTAQPLELVPVSLGEWAVEIPLQVNGLIHIIGCIAWRQHTQHPARGKPIDILATYKQCVLLAWG